MFRESDTIHYTTGGQTIHTPFSATFVRTYKAYASTDVNNADLAYLSNLTLKSGDKKDIIRRAAMGIPGEVRLLSGKAYHFKTPQNFLTIRGFVLGLLGEGVIYEQLCQVQALYTESGEALPLCRVETTGLGESMTCEITTTDGKYRVPFVSRVSKVFGATWSFGEYDLAQRTYLSMHGVMSKETLRTYDLIYTLKACDYFLCFLKFFNPDMYMDAILTCAARNGINPVRFYHLFSIDHNSGLGVKKLSVKSFPTPVKQAYPQLTDSEKLLAIVPRFGKSYSYVKGLIEACDDESYSVKGKTLVPMKQVAYGRFGVIIPEMAKGSYLANHRLMPAVSAHCYKFMQSYDLGEKQLFDDFNKLAWDPTFCLGGLEARIQDTHHVFLCAFLEDAVGFDLSIEDTARVVAKFMCKKANPKSSVGNQIGSLINIISQRSGLNVGPSTTEVELLAEVGDTSYGSGHPAIASVVVSNLKGCYNEPRRVTDADMVNDMHEFSFPRSDVCCDTFWSNKQRSEQMFDHGH